MIYESDFEDFKAYINAPDMIREHCADRLHRGELGLVLGAGVSLSAGFDGWLVLVNEVSAKFGLPPLSVGAETLALIERMDEVKVLAGASYAEAVRDQLYAKTYEASEIPGKDLYAAGIEASRELRAICSVLQAEPAGIRELLTFNFDSYLDDYMVKHGAIVESVGVVPILGSTFRRRVLHAHGYLPRNKDVDDARLVFSEEEYVHRAAGTEWWHLNWRFEIKSYLLRYQPIFVGLGGRPDAWHEDVFCIRQMMELVPSRRIVGFWLFDYVPPQEIIDSVCEMACVPLVLGSKEDVWIFLESIAEECQARVG